MSKDELNEKELDNVVGGLTTSLTDLSAEQQLSFQSTVESQTQTTQTLSNIQKKVSDTSSSIISNMK